MVDVNTLLKDVGLNYGANRGISIAVIGFGKMGLLHSAILNLLLGPYTVRYIVDKSLAVRIGGRLFLKRTQLLGSVEDLIKLEKEIDAVYVTTPTGSHYPVTKRLIEAGFKNVFLEKPPTRDLQQFTDLLDLSRNTIVMVGFQKRFSLLFRHAKLLLEKNIIGELKRIKCSIKSGDITEKTERYKKLGRGSLLDLGIHLLDLICWLFNEKPVVESTDYKSLYTGVDDVFRATLLLGDVRIEFETTWSDPSYRLPETHVELVGTDGVMRVSDDFLEVFSHEIMEASGENRVSIYKPNYYTEFPPVLVADPEYTIEDMHFLNAIENRQEPITSLESSVCTMQVLEELYEKALKRG